MILHHGLAGPLRTTGNVSIVGPVIWTLMAPVFIEVHVIVGANIARLFRLHLFFMEAANNDFLDRLPANGVDRVCDIGMEFRSAIAMSDRPVFIQAVAAVTAITAAQMILGTA